MTTGFLPPADAALGLLVCEVHVVCCDANIALCGVTVPGGDRYVADAGTCPLCRLADELGRPCSAPGCDVGRDVFDAELEFTLLGQCRVCGCTDDVACPGGCSWVDDPDRRGELCSACRPGVGAASHAGEGA